MQKFYFMVEKLNKLNVKLQGKENSLWLARRSFQTKLLLYIEDKESDKILHFENLKQYLNENSVLFQEFNEK